MKRALITGGAGFIGSNLAQRLLSEGWQVTIADDLSSGEKEFVPSGVYEFYGDFASDTLLNWVRKQYFDVVFHLAARARVGYSVDHPGESNDINVGKTVHLLEACVDNVERFVNTSSSSVYGGASKFDLPTHENHKHNPRSPYALQKSITERYCEMFSDVYNLETVSVRPFNVFGPNQKGDSPYSCAISAWLYAAKHGKPLRSDGDGEQTRDVTYVDNVVDVMYRCAIGPAKHFQGRAYNAGTGTRVSNNEILAWFKKQYPNVQVVNAPTRIGDVKDTQADIKRAENELGYKVLVSLWDGIEKTREWAMKSDKF